LDSKNVFRCFDAGFLLQALAIAALLIGLALVGKPLPHRSAARIGIALAESIGSGYLIVATLRRIGRLDELHQRIHLIAIAISFGATGVLITATEFLAKAGLPVRVPGPWLWLLMVLIWGVGASLIARRYR
jgi:hypothetical protein